MEERDKSPAANRLNTQPRPNFKTPKVASLEMSNVEAGLLHHAEMGPREKKLKTEEEGKCPFIRSERFPKSHLSPHLKLKEMV